jgi:tRNA dimethylallyltransferase
LLRRCAPRNDMLLMENQSAHIIPLLVIAGPTGVGKTQVAIALAEQIGGEIVGADSRQIYRYMDIGTAKPTSAERARIPHHLIDIRNPDEDYSAADYAKDASAVIGDIHARGKIPLLVGGTGLYIHAVLYGIFEGPGRDEAFRNDMYTLAKQHGAEYVHQRLSQIDPETARRLHPHDLVRIVRALEVHHLTGKPISEQQASATAPIAQYHSCFIVLTAQRDILYARINARVEQMIQQGFIEEVQGLLRRGYHTTLNAMNSVGYKEMVGYLAGKHDLPSTITLMQRNTRRYAKRQLTWFRQYQESVWICPETNEPIDDSVSRCLTLISRWQQDTSNSLHSRGLNPD